MRKGKERCNQENTPLLHPSSPGCSIFFQALNDYLANIIQFYTEKECEVNVELDHILSTSYSPSLPVIIIEEDELLSVPQSSFTSINVNDDRSSSTSITMISPSLAKNEKQKPVGDVTKQRLIELYTYLTKLKSFVSLNFKAFTEVLKKHDKLMNSSQGQTLLFQKVQTAYPFQDGTREHLDKLISQVELIYISMDESNQLHDLSSLLCENLDFDRGRLEESTEVSIEKLKIHKKIYTFLKALASLAIFAFLLSYPLFEHVEQQRCFALLVFSSILWATEVKTIRSLIVSLHNTNSRLLINCIFTSADAFVCHCPVCSIFDCYLKSNPFRRRC